MMDRFSIGELAQRADVPPKTIRYYEEIGLLPRAHRNHAGYRLYTLQDVERLNLIRRSKLLGLSLREIGEVVGYATSGQCEGLQQHLLGLLRTRSDEIDRQVQELLALKEYLRDLEADLSARLVSGEGRGAEDGSCSCLEPSIESGSGRRN